MNSAYNFMLGLTAWRLLWPAIAATKADKADHDARSGSRRSSNSQRPTHDDETGCATYAHYARRARRGGADMYQKRITVP